MSSRISKIIEADFSADHWIQAINKIRDNAKNETDWRALERVIARIQGIVAGILIGPNKNHPDLQKVADAKNKAVQEVEKKMKDAKKKVGY